MQELEQLEEEFNHHKDKVAEYENLQRLLSKHDSISISDNTILSQTDLQDEQVDKLRKQMKEKHKEVYEDFIRLKKKVVGDAEQMLFEDDRVNDLWQKAQEEEFSPEELQSIKVSNSATVSSVCTDVIRLILWVIWLGVVISQIIF